MGKKSWFYLEKNDIHISANGTTLSFLSELSTNLVQSLLLAAIFPQYEYWIILPSSIARLQPVVGLWKSMRVYESHGRLTAAVDVEICSCQPPMTRFPQPHHRLQTIEHEIIFLTDCQKMRVIVNTLSNPKSILLQDYKEAMFIQFILVFMI